MMNTRYDEMIHDDTDTVHDTRYTTYSELKPKDYSSPSFFLTGQNVRSTFLHASHPLVACNISWHRLRYCSLGLSTISFMPFLLPCGGVGPTDSNFVGLFH